MEISTRVCGVPVEGMQTSLSTAIWPVWRDCVTLVAEGNWVAILVDEELNLSGIVAFGETLDAVKELIEDFEEPIEIC